MTEPEMTEEAVKEIADVFPQIVESMTKLKVQFGLLGAACGVAAGAMIGFAIAYRQAETKFSKIADEEIASMREHYLEKARAAESQAAKRPVEDLVKERGYVSPDAKADGPPMAVQPPGKVMEAEDDAAGEPPDDSEMAADDVEGPNGVKQPPPEVRNIFRERDREAREAQAALPEWDYHEEKRRRSPDTPYVIHYDERHEMDYQEVTVTYYTVDDVLCDDRDAVIDPEDRDRLIGDGNLDRFGHGSNDPSIVYVRNDTLEIVYEVVKSPNSYAEEVHGLSHEGYSHGNLQRMRTRERDEPEE